MLSADGEDIRRLGLKAAQAASSTHGGFRIVGAEHQGLKQRASLWVPTTYGEWSSEYRAAWELLVTVTRDWPAGLRQEANVAILDSAREQLRVPSKVGIVLTDTERIAADPATDARAFTAFLIHQLYWLRDDGDRLLHFRLRRLDGRLTRRDIVSRFRRYVLDTTWEEWKDSAIDEDPENRAAMIAHCTPRSLEEDQGGALTRALLEKYARYDGVENGISARFHSGGWSGPESQHLRRKRDRSEPD